MSSNDELGHMHRDGSTCLLLVLHGTFLLHCTWTLCYVCSLLRFMLDWTRICIFYVCEHFLLLRHTISLSSSALLHALFVCRQMFIHITWHCTQTVFHSGCSTAMHVHTVIPPTLEDGSHSMTPHGAPEESHRLTLFSPHFKNGIG